jgi:hypothetical protein
MNAEPSVQPEPRAAGFLKSTLMATARLTKSFGEGRLSGDEAVNAEERQRLIELGFSPEVVARTEQVLAAWGVARLFATCCHCHEPCIDPDLPRGKRNRLKLPADLFHRREIVGCRDGHGRVACIPCEHFEFECG